MNDVFLSNSIFRLETQGRLQTYTMDPDHNNPKLMELRKLILQAFGNDADSRGIIFVRTRDLVKAIHRWMMETDDLRHLKPVMFTGAQAKSSAGGSKSSDAFQFLIKISAQPLI